MGPHVTHQHCYYKDDLLGCHRDLGLVLRPYSCSIHQTKCCKLGIQLFSLWSEQMINRTKHKYHFFFQNGAV